MYNPLLRGTPYEKPPPQQQRTGGGSPYSLNQIANLWVQRGGDPSVAMQMAHVALAESSGNPASNLSGATSYVENGKTYYPQGLYQISTIHGKKNMFDPAANTDAAIELYNAQKFAPWKASQDKWGPYVYGQQPAKVGFMTLPTQPSNPLLRGYTPPPQAQPAAQQAPSGNPLLRGYTPPTAHPAATPPPAAAPQQQQRKPLVTDNMTPQQKRAFTMALLGGQGTLPPRPSPLRTALNWWNVPLAYLEASLTDLPHDVKQMVTGKFFSAPPGQAVAGVIQHMKHGGPAEVAEHTLFSGPELQDIVKSPLASPANKAIASYLLKHPTITAGGSLAEQFINPANKIPFAPVVGFLGNIWKRAEPFVPLMQDVREISAHGAATFGYPFQLLHQAVTKQIGRGIYFAVRKLPGPMMKAASEFIDRYSQLADRGGQGYVQAAFAANAGADHAAAVGDKFMDDVFEGLTPLQHQQVEAYSAINDDGTMMANPADWKHVPPPTGPSIAERAAALRTYMIIKDAQQEALEIRTRTKVVQPSIAKQVQQPGAQPTIKRGDLRDSNTYFPGGEERMPGGKPEPVYKSQVAPDKTGKMPAKVEIAGLQGMGGRGRGKFSVGVTGRGGKTLGPRLKPEDFSEDLHPEYLSGYQVKAHYNEVNRAIANEEELRKLESLPSIDPETGLQRTAEYPGYGEVPLFARMPRYYGLVDEKTREVTTFGLGEEGKAGIKRYIRRQGFGVAAARARQDPLFLQVAQESGISPEELANLIDARKLRNVRVSPLKARLLEAKMTAERAAKVERALQNRLLRLAAQERALQGQITAAEAMTPIPVPEPRAAKGKPGEPPPEAPPPPPPGAPPPQPTAPAPGSAAARHGVPLLPLKKDGSYDVRNGYHSLPPEAQRALDAIPANETGFEPGHSSTKADEKLAMIALAKYGVRVKPTGAGELLSESRMYRPGGTSEQRKAAAAKPPPPPPTPETPEQKEAAPTVPQGLAPTQGRHDDRFIVGQNPPKHRNEPGYFVFDLEGEGEGVMHSFGTGRENLAAAEKYANELNAAYPPQPDIGKPPAPRDIGVPGPSYAELRDEARGRYHEALERYAAVNDELKDKPIRPGWFYKDGKWRLRGEYANVPKRFLDMRPPTGPPRSMTDARLGDEDDKATELGFEDGGALLEHLSTMRRPIIADFMREPPPSRMAGRPRGKQPPPPGQQFQVEQREGVIDDRPWAVVDTAQMVGPKKSAGATSISYHPTRAAAEAHAAYLEEHGLPPEAGTTPYLKEPEKFWPSAGIGEPPEVSMGKPPAAPKTFAELPEEAQRILTADVTKSGGTTTGALQKKLAALKPPVRVDENTISAMAQEVLDKHVTEARLTPTQRGILTTEELKAVQQVFGTIPRAKILNQLRRVFDTGVDLDPRVWGKELVAQAKQARELLPKPEPPPAAPEELSLDAAMGMLDRPASEVRPGVVEFYSEHPVMGNARVPSRVLVRYEVPADKLTQWAKDVDEQGLTHSYDAEKELLPQAKVVGADFSDYGPVKIGKSGKQYVVKEYLAPGADSHQFHEAATLDEAKALKAKIEAKHAGEKVIANKWIADNTPELPAGLDIEDFERGLAHKGDTPETRAAYDKVFKRIADGEEPNVQGVDPAFVQASQKLCRCLHLSKLSRVLRPPRNHAGRGSETHHGSRGQSCNATHQ